MGRLVGRKTGIGVVVVFLAVAANQYRNHKTLSPVLEISTGKIQGIVSYSREGREIHEYLSIPYGKAPVGDLRFAPPQKVEPWMGIHDSTVSGPNCAQLSLLSMSVDGSEDCLALNVYTPASRKGPLPVMVWLHGGGFFFGNGGRYKPGYLIDEDVILVSPNYRLSVLGFLNTGDDVARGNQGLKDQNLALKWVQENIKYFGGDPNQVTIFGESAGSISVASHILSPMSKGLFRNAIMQSGSPVAEWLVNKDPGKQARQLAEKLNCSHVKTSEMIACMRKVDSTSIFMAYQKLLLPLSDTTSLFAPTVESFKDADTFLGESPLEILKSGKFNKVPLITGVNKDEGTLFSAVLGANQTKLQQANDEWDFYAPRLLSYDTKRPDISEKIRKFYFGNAQNIASINFIDNFTNIFSDRHFLHPTHNFVKYYAKHAPVRLYWYSYSADFGLTDILPSTQSETLPIWASAGWELTKRWVYRELGYHIPHLGICHGDEVQLIFTFPFRRYIKASAKDTIMSKLMLKLWTDFVRNKDSLSIKGVTWPIINCDSVGFQYLDINENPKMIDEPFTERMKFWDNLGI